MEILLVQLKDYAETDWNIPGGGIEKGETPENTIKRELKEELGTNKFEILGESKITTKYEWPDYVIAKRLKEEKSTYRGQEQSHFILKFTGKN